MVSVLLWWAFLVKVRIMLELEFFMYYWNYIKQFFSDGFNIQHEGNILLLQGTSCNALETFQFILINTAYFLHYKIVSPFIISHMFLLPLGNVNATKSILWMYSCFSAILILFLHKFLRHGCNIQNNKFLRHSISIFDTNTHY